MKFCSASFSILFAILGYLCCKINYAITADTPIGCILWTAEAFAVTMIMGCIGLELSLFINRKKITVIGRRKFILTVILALILGFLTGAAGQFLFALNTEKEVKGPTKKATDTSIVFMMDSSGSMSDVYKDCIEASCDFIDELGDSCYYQYIAFSGTSDPKTPLLQLTDKNKELIKEAARNSSLCASGTWFDPPLKDAYNTLTNNSNSRKKIAILFSDCVTSDGYSFVSEEVVNMYKSSDIKLYIIMVSDNRDATLSSNDPLSQIAYELFTVTADNYGKIDISNFSEILKNASLGIDRGDIYRQKVILDEEMMLTSKDESLIEFIVRIATYTTFSLIVGIIYYGFESKKLIIINAFLGLIAGLMTIISPKIGLFVLIVLSLTAMVDFHNVET